MLEELQKIEFHDGTLLGLTFVFSDKRIDMLMEQGVEAPAIALSFVNISALNVEEVIGFNNIEDIEIYSAEFLQESNRIKAKFVFLLDQGPSWELTFSFVDGKVRRVE